MATPFNFPQNQPRSISTTGTKRLRSLFPGRAPPWLGWLALLASLLPVASPAGQAGSSVTGNPARGQTVFEQHCSGCHALGENRFGPRLGDVYGRRAGSIPGFHYSQALQRQPLTWSAATLDHWLTGPARFLPGARMTISINDAARRADVIAYLRSHPASDEE